MAKRTTKADSGREAHLVDQFGTEDELAAEANELNARIAAASREGTGRPCADCDCHARRADKCAEANCSLRSGHGPMHQRLDLWMWSASPTLEGQRW